MYIFFLSSFNNPIIHEHSCTTKISNSIRIYHECEGRIENPVPWITVWHHEACQVMTNGDP